MTLAQAVDPTVLSSGTAQEILAVVVAMLLASLAWVVRTYLADRTRLEKRNSELLSLHAQKLEELHGRTLEIALKTQKAILKLGEPNEEP